MSRLPARAVATATIKAESREESARSSPDFPPPNPLHPFIVYSLLLFIILMLWTFSPLAGKWYSVFTGLRFQAINNGFSASHAIRRVDA